MITYNNRTTILFTVTISYYFLTVGQMDHVLSLPVRFS